MNQIDVPPLFISEKKVKELLTWPLVYEATEQALIGICKLQISQDQPVAHQPARSLTIIPDNSGE